MALGSGATLHRKRLKSSNKATKDAIGAALRAHKKGNCGAAQNWIVTAAMHAGVSFANDVAIRRKRKKRLHLGTSPDVKAVYAAKKLISKSCSISPKKAR